MVTACCWETMHWGCRLSSVVVPIADPASPHRGPGPVLPICFCIGWVLTCCRRLVSRMTDNNLPKAAEVAAKARVRPHEGGARNSGSGP